MKSFFLLFLLSIIGLSITSFAQSSFTMNTHVENDSRNNETMVTLAVSNSTGHLLDECDYKFLWITGDTLSQINIRMPEETTDYSVTITNSDGFYEVVTISSDCFLNLTISPNQTCPGQPVTLVVTNNLGIPLQSGMGYYFQWSDGVTTPSRVEFPLVNTDYSVTVTYQPTGCSTSMQRTAIVNPATPVFIVGPDKVCQGESATYKVVDQYGNTIPNAGYWWSTGAENTNSVTITINDPTTLAVTVTLNGSACSSNDTKDIGVFPKPPVSIEYIQAPGQTTALVHSVPGATYLWTDNTKNQFRKFTQPQLTFVIVTDQNGCTNIADVDVYSIFECPPTDLDTVTIVIHDIDTVLIVETITIEVPVYVPYPVHDTVWIDPGCPDYSGITANVGNGIVCEDTYLYLTAPVANSYEWGDGTQERILVVGTNNPGVRLYSCVINGNQQLFFQVIVYSKLLPKPNVATVGGGDVFCDSTTLATDQIDTNFLYQWYRNGVAMFGATSPSVKIGLSGDYSVRVTTPCNTQTSDGAWVTIVDCGGVTGVVETDRNNNISVYPNPSNGVFQVDIPNEAALQYVLYDSNGRIVLHENAIDDFEVVRPDLPRGFYILQVITNENNLFVKKVEIQ